MSRLTDTHFYDGQLAPIKAQLQSDLDRAHQKTPQEQLVAFQLLREQLPAIAHPNFDVIVRDLAQKTNYDPTNDLLANDLLYLCAERAANEGFIDLLTAQLLEMSTGMCAQGRTHRLLQILWATQATPE